MANKPSSIKTIFKDNPHLRLIPEFKNLSNPEMFLVVCIADFNNPIRIRYINENGNKYDFKQCEYYVRELTMFSMGSPFAHNKKVLSPRGNDVLLGKDRTIEKAVSVYRNIYNFDLLESVYFGILKKKHFLIKFNINNGSVEALKYYRELTESGAVFTDISYYQKLVNELSVNYTDKESECRPNTLKKAFIELTPNENNRIWAIDGSEEDWCYFEFPPYNVTIGKPIISQDEIFGGQVVQNRVIGKAMGSLVSFLPKLNFKISDMRISERPEAKLIQYNGHACLVEDRLVILSEAGDILLDVIPENEPTYKIKRFELISDMMNRRLNGH